jgi:hypothetical protein
MDATKEALASAAGSLSDMGSKRGLITSSGQTAAGTTALQPPSSPKAKQRAFFTLGGTDGSLHTQLSRESSMDSSLPLSPLSRQVSMDEYGGHLGVRPQSPRISVVDVKGGVRRSPYALLADRGSGMVLRYYEAQVDEYRSATGSLFNDLVAKARMAMLSRVRSIQRVTCGFLYCSASRR